MKYIIMCGGVYNKWETPRQLLKVNGEVLVERTIRLLRENGIDDIAISTNDPRFDYLDVEILHDDCNLYEYGGSEENTNALKSWLEAYYLLDAPCCYLHGDVYFSDDAIKKIVNKKVKDTMFICVPDKQDVKRKSKLNLKGREPLGYKVQNYELFNKAVNELLYMVRDQKFKDAKITPISWTVYRYLNHMDLGFKAQNYNDLNGIFKSKGDYMIINDYTTDIDFPKDIEKIEEVLSNDKTNKKNDIHK